MEQLREQLRRAADFTWPARALVAATPAEAVRILAPADPRAALGYLNARCPAEGCELCGQSREAWAALLASLTPATAPPACWGSRQTKWADARCEALERLADALPPAPLFALIGTLMGGDMGGDMGRANAVDVEWLRERSLAGAARRGLRRVVSACVIEEGRAWSKAGRRTEHEHGGAPAPRPVHAKLSTRPAPYM